MKKKITLVTLSVVFLMLSACSSQEITQSESVLSEATEISESELRSSLDEYQPLDLVKSVEITPDADYDSGAFCRFYYDENEGELLATFGTGMVTGSAKPEEDSYVGGGEGGQGSIYKYYSTDLKSTGKTDYYYTGGGDLATVKVGDYFYHLTGGPEGWRLAKFDIKTWEELDRIDIELNEDEGANDQMLVYVNGMLIASSGYAENANGADTEGNEGDKRDPSVGIYTHHHAFDLDLNAIDEWILDDIRHSNGSSMVFVDGVYQFVSGTAFFGDLMVMQYDEEWNYLGSKTLLKGAQWPQRTVYDEETENYYVAYLGIDGAIRSEVRLAVFDKDWNLLSNTAVSDFGNNYFAGRPAVLLLDGKAYVSYDKETIDAQSHEAEKDWQCSVSTFEMMD